MRIFLLNDCCEHDCLYGCLVTDKKEVTVKMIQDKIYEAKSKFNEQDIDDWDISDVLGTFPIEWNLTFFDEISEEIGHLEI